MILYHGSNQLVRDIDLEKSRLGKDFGRAFYLSEEKEQAMEMARFKVETFGGESVVNEFEFDENILRESKLKYLHFENYSEEWARFVLMNRNSLEMNNLHDNDVVFGPVANDRIGRQIFNFNSGYIDFETFLKRIQYPIGVTFQWAFCTEMSIRFLKYRK